MKEILAHLRQSTDFVELAANPRLVIDLRYATTNNVLGRNLYGAFDRAFVHRETEKQLSKATAALHPNHRFIIFDALRPRSVQRSIWESVRGTPMQMYFADPEKGSLHNYGLALDLSLLNEHGRELDMGAGFDDFREIAWPEHEARFKASGELSDLQLSNRDELRRVMAAGGFTQLAHEWWHFNACSLAEARARFRIIE